MSSYRLGNLLKEKILFLNRNLKRLFMNNLLSLLSGSTLLVITLILPYSGDGKEVQLGWWDQSLFLASLKEALSGKSPVGVTEGLVGPGYIALGVITTKILGTNPATSLVILNRVSFFSTVLVFFVISSLLLRKVLQANVQIPASIYGHKAIIIANILAFLYTFTLVLSSNFVSFSDIPWTHFPATLLTLVCILSTVYSVEGLTNNRPTQYVSFTILGTALGLLMQVRFFEGVIFVAALVVWLLLLFLKHLKSSKKGLWLTIKAVPVVLFSFIVTSYLSLFLSHTKNFHMLYFTLAKHNPTIREITKIYIDNFPLKFIQLFIDPNFFSMNQNYTIQPIIFGFNFTSWKMPLVLQVPVLIYLLPCTLILLVFILFVKKDTSFFLSAEFFLPLLVATGLITGYVSSAASGSPHLKYGFVRDFMAPTWCLALTAGPWIFYSYIGSHIVYVRKLLLLLPSALPIFICLLYGQVLIKFTPFFQFKDFHIQTLNLSHHCSGLECSVRVKMYNSKKQLVEAPRQRYIITSLCPSTAEQTAVTLSSENQLFTLPSCVESYPVNVFPVNMGYAGTPEAPASWVFKPAK
jgi:hypothetical protein